MRVFIVTYMCSVVGAYSCAVDAEQCIRALKRTGCTGATVCEARLNMETTVGNLTFKAATGHPVGTLRKSIEQQSLYEHIQDRTNMTLQMCTEVCKRCQHRAETAMGKYVSTELQKLRRRLGVPDTGASTQPPTAAVTTPDSVSADTPTDITGMIEACVASVTRGKWPSQWGGGGDHNHAARSSS